jgi:ssDNA-binding Zn-finger/Zn-ribbon topoisomerase 1
MRNCKVGFKSDSSVIDAKNTKSTNCDVGYSAQNRSTLYCSNSEAAACDYKRNLGDKPKAEVEIVEGMKCPECGSDMCKRKGRYGDFISCTNYPTCKHIHYDKPKAEKTGETCPACKKGELVIRTGKRGKFKACNRFPKCKHIENIE